MSKATAVITDKFKNTFIKSTNAENFKRIQELMFKMGFRWASGHRTIFKYDGPYIFVDKNCEISTGSSLGKPWCLDYKAMTMYDLRQSSDDVVKIKREESKASKKRRAQRKWDATATKNDFIGCPVRRDVLIAAKLRDGELVTEKAGWFKRWRHTGASDDIMSYKIIKRNEHKPKTVETTSVSFDDMVRGIAADLGKEVAVVPVADSEGWIEWDGTNYKPEDSNYHANYQHGPVVQGTVVDIRFRGGREELEVVAGVAAGQANGAYWCNDGMSNDIVAYRVVGGYIPAGMMEPKLVGEAADSQPDRLAADTNPKRQYGVQSVPLNMWSPLASAYGALGLYNGSLKYGKANFANTPVEASIYIAAAMRHLMAWACGQEDDPADGVPNLGGVLANIAILLESRAAGMLIDDRLKMAGYLSELEMLKGKVKFLSALHADKNPKHYTMEQK